VVLKRLWNVSTGFLDPPKSSKSTFSPTPLNHPTTKTQYFSSTNFDPTPYILDLTKTPSQDSRILGFSVRMIGILGGEVGRFSNLQTSPKKLKNPREFV